MKIATVPCTICTVCGYTIDPSPEDTALRLYRCRNCGHVFKNLPKEKQERYERGYFIEEHKNWFVNPDYPLFDHIYRQMRRLKGPGKIRVLDVGCGNGAFLKYLRSLDKDLELYGIDLIDNESPGITFIKGDIMDCLRDVKYDVVTNLAVIEHVESPRNFMAKMLEILLPDGVLFTVTDNDDSMMYQAARIMKKAGFGEGYNRLYATHHLQCFSNRSLRELVMNCGFDIIDHRNHNHPVEAVDYPKAGVVKTALFILATRTIFMVSGLLGNGMLQIAICRKRKGGDRVDAG